MLKRFLLTLILVFVASSTVGHAQSADGLTVKLATPVGDDDYEDAITSTTIASASWTEFPSTDIPARLRNNYNAQIVTVSNLDGAAKLCVRWIARSGAADCSTRAASITRTCNGGAADADYVMPLAQRQFAIKGDQCVFFRTTVDQTDGQLTLIAR